MDEVVTNGELRAGPLELSSDHLHVYAEYRRLSAEQAALRRLATLVARGVEPSEVFDAVVHEMRQCLLTDAAGLWRYEKSGEITLIAIDYRSPSPAAWPVGTRMAMDGNCVAAMVQRTRQPARMDSYENVAGSIAARVRAVGGAHAAVGVPVIVDGRVWGLATVGSVELVRMPADTEARISGFAELIGVAVVAGYRDEQKRQMLDDTSQRSWIDALLEGRVVDDCSLAEVASCLRLPKDGPFVVIAAEMDNRGSEALPVIESKLRSLDVYSAWRLLPDWQVGIAAVTSEQQLDRVVALVSRTAVARVGVSARFTDLRETPQAMHFAKMSLLQRADKGSWVAVFDGTILATAALAAPEVMVKSADRVLACFGDLPEEERDILFETFRVWQETDASVVVAGEQLNCHPNTVRYRLRRIEKRTGLSLSRPKDVAELCLAFEIHRRLI